MSMARRWSFASISFRMVSLHGSAPKKPAFSAVFERSRPSSRAASAR